MSSSSKEKLKAKLDRRDRTIVHLQKENDELSKKVRQLNEEVGRLKETKQAMLATSRRKGKGRNSVGKGKLDATDMAIVNVLGGTRFADIIRFNPLLRSDEYAFRGPFYDMLWPYLPKPTRKEDHQWFWDDRVLPLVNRRLREATGQLTKKIRESYEAWVQAKGLMYVTNKFETAFQFMSNYAGDEVDFDDGSVTPLFEFLSEVVGPACYGEDDLKERLNNNPTKTFLDIVTRAEIALCFCTIDFCRKSWAHDNDIKQLSKDQQEMYKVKNQKDMTPNTKIRYTRTKSDHVGTHKIYLEPSWSEEGLDAFLALEKNIEDFLDDPAKHDDLKSSWSTYVDETGFALHHVATKSTSSGENSSSRRKSSTTKKSRGTKLKFGSQLSGAVASERGMSVGDLSGDESSDEGAPRPKRVPLKMAESPSSTKSSNSGDSNGSESEDEMDSPPSVKKRSSDLPSKPKAPKRRKN